MSTIAPIAPQANLPVIFMGSLAANLILWYALGQGSSQPVRIVAPPELVFERVVVDKQANPAKPVYHPIPIKPRATVQPKKEPPKFVHSKPPPPEGAHNRFVTQKTPAPSDHTSFVVPSGGNAPVGKPTDAQNPGNAVVNPPTAPPVVTPPQTQSDVKQTTPPVQPVVPSAPPVKHEASPPPPPPPPPPPVKPKGETREAKADHQESVEIPENLKSQSFKSFVRVRVEISADGKFKVVLRTSSGNSDVDKLVLDTLNKWTWKPALKDGDPVDSVQQFRFNFSIE